MQRQDKAQQPDRSGAGQCGGKIADQVFHLCHDAVTDQTAVDIHIDQDAGVTDNGQGPHQGHHAGAGADDDQYQADNALDQLHPEIKPSPAQGLDDIGIERIHRKNQARNAQDLEIRDRNLPFWPVQQQDQGTRNDNQQSHQRKIDIVDRLGVAAEGLDQLRLVILEGRKHRKGHLVDDM